MKLSKIYRLLALSTILALLLSVSAGTAQAAGTIVLDPTEGKIGDWFGVDCQGFDASKVVRLYFSSDKAKVGNKIDAQVTAYERITGYTFTVPDRLTDGSYEEDVHGGDYYVYAIYGGSQEIVAMATFTVIDGEICLDPEEDTVGSEVEISGEGLRTNQKISAEYDGDEVDIISGDSETDSEGQFTCTVIIPESASGIHTIAVIDESGNKPEAEFTVNPKITLSPAEQVASKEVIVTGTGFGKKEIITIALDGSKISTTPLLIYTNYYGSFSASFLAPSVASYTTIKVEAGKAVYGQIIGGVEAQLTIVGGISLDPVTSPTSPGYVGMELSVRGGGFTADTMVTITYSTNGEVIPVTTARTDAYGNFSASFSVPPSVAGSYVITATDGTTTVASTFTMESQAPSVPVPLLPRVIGTVSPEAHFDWEDVTDPSGVSYTLQVALDADFTAIVLEKEGLLYSEYTLIEEERLESTEKKAYYWRVKAVDGAFNGGEWSHPGLFYVGFSPTSMPGWVWYIFYGLGALLLAILGFWVRKRFTQ